MLDVIHATKRIELVMYMIHFDRLDDEKKHVVVSHNFVQKFTTTRDFDAISFFVERIKIRFDFVKQTIKLLMHFNIKFARVLFCKIVNIISMISLSILKICKLKFILSLKQQCQYLSLLKVERHSTFH